MFKDIVHSILKNYRETKRFFWEKPSKLKNLILLFSFAINDRINPLMLSALVRSVITAVNITERQMSFYPEVKATYKVAGDMSAKEGIYEVLKAQNFFQFSINYFFLIQLNPDVPYTSLISLFIPHAKE